MRLQTSVSSPSVPPSNSSVVHAISHLKYATIAYIPHDRNLWCPLPSHYVPYIANSEMQLQASIAMVYVMFQAILQEDTFFAFTFKFECFSLLSLSPTLGFFPSQSPWWRELP